MMFIFDNSASMLANASGTFVGENTNICPSSATSKLFSLKAALRAALADVGTRANVGLMSFPTVERTPPAYSMTAWCPTQQGGPAGHYAPAPAKAGRNLGCDMTSHDGETTFGPWFAVGAGEVIRTGVTTAPVGTTPLWFDYDPFDANVPAVGSWINNIELPADPGKVTDPELHGMSNTPLGRSLFYARLYFDNFVIPVDPHAACRQNVVVLLTDGNETCDTAAPDQTFDTGTCAGGGTTFSPFHPAYQACRLRLESGIKTYVIADIGTDIAGMRDADRIATAGGTSAAVRVSLTDSTPARVAIQRAIALSTMPAAGCPM
jgi:hypothetical protein